MKRMLSITAAVLLATAALVSCDPGPAGLFALLELEKPLDKGTAAFNANTAAFVVRVNGATDYYYAAVGATLLRRPVAGTTWETVTVPGAPAGSIISSGVSDRNETCTFPTPPEADTHSGNSDGTGVDDYV